MLPSKSGAVSYYLLLSTDNVTMVSFVLRKNKAAVLLYIQHLDYSVTESEQNKPNITFWGITNLRVFSIQLMKCSKSFLVIEFLEDNPLFY